VAYITDLQLKAAAAAALAQGTQGDLGEHWAAAVTRGNRAAYQRIRAVLLGRGFTAAQIDDWDGRVEWSEQVGLNRAQWYATMDVDVRRALNDELKAMLEELALLPIEIDEEQATPTSGRISYGIYDTDDDIHTIDDVL
jgi:hypothetical protein